MKLRRRFYLVRANNDPLFFEESIIQSSGYVKRHKQGALNNNQRIYKMFAFFGNFLVFGFTNLIDVQFLRT